MRAPYLAAALVTMALGLFAHLHGASLGVVRRDVVGDVLWAAMIAFWIGALAPMARLTMRAIVAYAICAIVEVSQLLHTPVLDTLRATRVGQLVLGSGFDARDFLAYAIGVSMAALIDAVARIRRPR
ncbi:MAG: DUF2809 domain-containing protein [Gemmatimonadaceae bacterium]